MIDVGADPGWIIVFRTSPMGCIGSSDSRNVEHAVEQARVFPVFHMPLDSKVNSI